jgi:hypothetical protein
MIIIILLNDVCRFPEGHKKTEGLSLLFIQPKTTHMFNPFLFMDFDCYDMNYIFNPILGHLIAPGFIINIT